MGGSVPQKTAQPQQQTTQVSYGSHPVPSTIGADAPHRMSKGLKIFLIIFSLLILAGAILLGFFWDKVISLF